MENKVIYLDGAMGTQLQANGLRPGELPEVFMMENEEVIVQIHRDYVEHGSEIIYANTFGANRKKLIKSGYQVETIIAKAIELAQKGANGKAKVALDIGPIGELLEPNGYLSFEEAYDIFKEQIIAGEKAGADLVVFETMSDLLEIKAGILAAKENSSLPIFVTMSFESDGRTFTGCSVESFGVTATRLGVDALGINCSLGPEEILPIAKRLAMVTSLPLIIKANAGLPDPMTSLYAMDADSFAKQMKAYETLPISYIGGCCGTTPEFIEVLCKEVTTGSDLHYQDRGYACSPTCCIALKDIHVVGERINPTGNKKMKEALRNNDLDAILSIALEEVEAGADILDVNVGLPGIDEKEMMVRVIKELQTIIDVPLQIDSTDPAVIEAALRVYNGIPIVNSCNGEQSSMDTILPLIAKYGANIIGLTMDEQGIPMSCEERLIIARRILSEAQGYGITKERVFLDCLTLTVSAQQDQAMETLHTLQAIRQELGVQCVLGVSNISFGLPQRGILNQYFLTMALSAGLTMPIINPNQKAMMDAVNSYRVIAGLDVDCMDYVETYSNQLKQEISNIASKELTLIEAICKGLKEDTRALTREALQTSDALSIVNEQLIPALDIVGDRYEKKEIYLPGLINAATASQGAFEEIRKELLKSGAQSISKGKIILATVKGDVHDIGKNIVKVVLENYGFTVLDLGKDVPVETVVETAIKEHVYLIGLSALMTTTLSSMKETIEALHASGHECKVMVGGAVVSPEYAKEIHADYYAKDAKQSADIAKEVFGC